MASVAEDNIVQVWQMCENIYLQEDDLPDVRSPPHPTTFRCILSRRWCAPQTRSPQAAAHELEVQAE